MGTTIERRINNSLSWVAFTARKTHWYKPIYLFIYFNAALTVVLIEKAVSTAFQIGLNQICRAQATLFETWLISSPISIHWLTDIPILLRAKKLREASCKKSPRPFYLMKSKGEGSQEVFS
jgi:hypothetical protein